MPVADPQLPGRGPTPGPSANPIVGGLLTGTPKKSCVAGGGNPGGRVNPEPIAGDPGRSSKAPATQSPDPRTDGARKSG